MFLHKLSVSENLSFQPNVFDLDDYLIHQGMAAMVVVEDLECIVLKLTWLASAKINFSYSILFHLTTSYSSCFGGKKGISRNKTSFFLLMC